MVRLPKSDISKAFAHPIAQVIAEDVQGAARMAETAGLKELAAILTAVLAAMIAGKPGQALLAQHAIQLVEVLEPILEAQVKRKENK